MAVIGKSGSGTWWYTTDGGATWLTLNPTTNSARLLAADANNTRVYYQPALNENGSTIASLTIRAWNQTGGSNGDPVDLSGSIPTESFSSATDTVDVTVTAVNDVPTFTKGADQMVFEDGGVVSIPGWATAITPGGGSFPESGQTLSFIVSTNNPGLFSAGPAVAANGTLTFTPALNTNGSATVTVQLHDDGGTANGGVDTSPSQNFTITITAVNDAPVFTKGADQTVLEDSGVTTVTGWATGISPGGGSFPDSGQTLNFNVSTTNPGLFSASPAVAANGTLTFTPALNAKGSATVTVQIHDDGGTLNNGVDTSPSQTFTITVSPVNDAPVFTKGADQTALEDSGVTTVSGWATGISPGGGSDEAGQTLNFIVSTNNPGLFSAGPAVNATSGTLTFTPKANANGSATVTVQLHDDGGTVNNGVDTSPSQNFTITVSPVNDAPVFTKGANQTVSENNGLKTVTGWATGISPGGGSDESGADAEFYHHNE